MSNQILYIMETKIIRTLSLFICLIVGITTTYAESGYLTISGIIKDKSNNKKLEYVTISVSETNIGTITNEDGMFILKINDSIKVPYIEFTHIGYKTTRIPYPEKDILNQTFYMIPNPLELKEVVVDPKDPVWILEQAFNRISHNYSVSPNLLTSFYRETVKKRRKL